MPKKAKELSALAVSKLKAEGRYAVGGADGLYLCIVGNSRTWSLRFAVGTRKNSKGKIVVHRRDMGLGSYPDVSLAEARDKARELRRQIKSGIDPLEEKKRNKEAQRIQQRNTRTFRECADVVLENKSRELKSINGHESWRRTFERYVFPMLGERIVGNITRADVAAVLEPIWHEKHRTAKELRGRIEAVLDYAKAMEYREGDNPATWKGVLAPILGRVKRKARPQPSLSYTEIGAFMTELRKQQSIFARALELIILTATRAGEAFGATWEEFDMTARIWTIPAERMKAEKEHRVPLSDEAVKMLESLPRVSDSRYVFLTSRGGCVSHASVYKLIKGMHETNIEAGGKGFIDPKVNSVITIHGFRSTFRDWAAETTAYPWEVCEHALAHKLGDKVEAAYQRGDLLAKRTRLMADWARYCGTIQPPADAVFGNAVSDENRIQ
jgi:integrase